MQNLELKRDKFYPEHLSSFVKRASGIQLRDYQLEAGRRIINSVLNNLGETHYILQARQTGKTETIADSAFFLGCTVGTIYQPHHLSNGLRIGIFAPKERQSLIDLRRLKQRFSSPWVRLAFDLEFDVFNKNEIRLSNKNIIHASTGSIMATVEGETYDLIIIEEAQDMDDLRIEKSILPMVASCNGTKILCGAPTPESKGYFYYQSRTANVHRKIIFNCYECLEQMAPQDRINYRRFITDYIKRHGDDSVSFQTQFLLKWLGEAKTFIEMEMLEKLKTGTRKEIEKEFECFAGIDVAKASDSTVVTIIRGDSQSKIHILNWLELKGEEADDYTKQIESIKNFLNSYNIRKICVDSLGVGDSPTDFLKKEFGDEMVKGVPLTSKNKSELYEHLLMLIKQQRLTYPEEDFLLRYRFERQFTELEQKYRDGRLYCSHPKSKGSRDDFCDSLVLAIKASEQTSLFMDIGVVER